MSLENYQAAIQPKVQGSWNLHQLLPATLDFFVMLSSVSGVGGNATQSNYSAGSTFQESLAKHRVTSGKSAVSLSLGMVKGIGVLSSADGQKTASRLERIGLRALDESEVLRLIEAAVRPGWSKAHMVTGIPATWARPESDNNAENQAMAAFWIRDPRFSPLESVSQGQTQNRRQDGMVSLVEVLSDPNVDDKGACAALTDALISKLAGMFVMPESEIDSAATLSQLGVDSLLAVELRNWVSVAAQAECSVFDIMQAASVASLAEKLVVQSTLRPRIHRMSNGAAVNGVNGHM